MDLVLLMLPFMWLLVPDARAATSTDESRNNLTIGFIMVASDFQLRSYQRRITDTLKKLKPSRELPFEFLQNYYPVQSNLYPLRKDRPSPKEILDCFCDKFFPNNIPVIVHVTNMKLVGNTATTEYLFQLTNYLRIPVIAWNAANSAFKPRQANSLVLQMAPSLRHEVAAMLDILRQFEYHVFSVLTTQISGYKAFVKAVRELTMELETDDLNPYQFTVLGYDTLNTNNSAEVDKKLKTLKETRTRIILLYSNLEDATLIFTRAQKHELIGREYLWLVSQSVTGDLTRRSIKKSFPVGLVGISFDTDEEAMMSSLEKAIMVFANGLVLFHKDPLNANRATVIRPHLSCNESGQDANSTSLWQEGPRLYRYLQKVNFTFKATIKGVEPIDTPSIPVQFYDEGILNNVKLDVVNLRKNREWQKVGTWTEGDLQMMGIVWPGGANTPPLGVPEKFHLRVTFLEEKPYLEMVEPDRNTRTCREKDVHCIIPLNTTDNRTEINTQNDTYSNRRCCSGFTVDLMNMLSKDIGFTFEMIRVADGLWGAKLNKTGGKEYWNGLIAELMDGTADIAMTSLKINVERARVVDFSVPFLETGISIIVRKRTGIISPQAFLEPFDTISWIVILVFSVQAAAIAIFLFEWLSGRQERRQDSDDGELTLFRTFWLAWAMLFGAAVDVMCPRGFTARIMANVWCTFAVIFNAIYTANLAAFMITREDFHNLTGVEDFRIQNVSMLPQEERLRFGTIPFGNTEIILKEKYPEMSRYMSKNSRPTVGEGIKAVRDGSLDAFIYDATVLDYLVGQDKQCSMLTVGDWYAKTGYGIAFQRKSKLIRDFNHWILHYRAHGDLARMKEFWLAGACTKGKMPMLDMSFSHASLSVDEFISAFLLLGAGIILATIIMFAERCYDAHLRKRLLNGGATSRRKEVLALLSQNLAKSLTFQDAVQKMGDHVNTEANHKCENPLCDTLLWKARRKMDLYRLMAEQLEEQLKALSAKAIEPAKAIEIAKATKKGKAPKPPKVEESPKATKLPTAVETQKSVDPAKAVDVEPPNNGESAITQPDVPHIAIQPSNENSSPKTPENKDPPPKSKDVFHINQWYV